MLVGQFNIQHHRLLMSRREPDIRYKLALLPLPHNSHHHHPHCPHNHHNFVQLLFLILSSHHPHKIIIISAAALAFSVCSSLQCRCALLERTAEWPQKNSPSFISIIIIIIYYCHHHQSHHYRLTVSAQVLSGQICKLVFPSANQVVTIE